MNLNDLRDDWEREHQDEPDEYTRAMCVQYVFSKLGNLHSIKEYCRSIGIKYDGDRGNFWVYLATKLSESAAKYDYNIYLSDDEVIQRWDRFVSWYDAMCKLEFIWRL